MNTDKIYNTLEEKLSQFWTEKKEAKTDKEAVSQYLMPYANLKYFTKADGSFLYAHNEQGQLAGLDYQVIYTQSPELKKLKEDGSVDKEATIKGINEVFQQTNESFKKMKLISEFRDYSRFNSRFGMKHHATSYLPSISMDLLALQNISELPKIIGMHFMNALNFVGKLAPASYKAITEKIESSQPFMASFLEICRVKYASFGDKGFRMNKYLDEKIMNIVSSIDDIDKAECSQPLMKSRASDSLIMRFSPAQFTQNTILIDEKIFSKYASKDMKIALDKLTKKSKKDEEE